ncbi:MAG: SDR family NAD(P)-dependent oxidoreductase, partial [Christensenellales bacterium]
MRTVVITGASSGIGKELCSLFENDGFEVIKIARSINNPENNQYSCDVSNFDQVLETFKRISEKH